MYWLTFFVAVARSNLKKKKSLFWLMVLEEKSTVVDKKWRQKRNLREHM